MTVTVPEDVAAEVRTAVEEGEYASSSAVVEEALRDWKNKRTAQVEAFAALKADIDLGLADLAAGRVHDWNTAEIIEQGRQLFGTRSNSG